MSEYRLPGLHLRQVLAFAMAAFALLLAPLAAAAPLTSADEAKMAGRWLVNGGNSSRVYEITPGRNIHIMGGRHGDRRGRLAVEPDGTYLFKLDEGSLRISYTPASDQLTVTYYKGKKDFELGLKPMWSVQGTRKKD